MCTAIPRGLSPRGRSTRPVHSRANAETQRTKFVAHGQRGRDRACPPSRRARNPRWAPLWPGRSPRPSRARGPPPLQHARPTSAPMGSRRHGAVSHTSRKGRARASALGTSPRRECTSARPPSSRRGPPAPSPPHPSPLGRRPSAFRSPADRHRGRRAGAALVEADQAGKRRQALVDATSSGCAQSSSRCEKNPWPKTRSNGPSPVTW